MLLLFNPESRPLTRLRIMTQRLDLRGMASGNKENGCSPSQTLIAHWQPLRFSRSTVIFYHCFWRSDKKNGCLPSQTLTAHWQRLRFHEAQSSFIVFGGLIKRRVVAVANAHCSLATSAVSRSPLIFHCLWRSDKKNGCSPSQTLTAHWQPLRFHEAHSSTIVCGGLIFKESVI